MSKINLYLLIVVISCLFSSCAKDGATGAVGPQGLEGNDNVSSYTFSTASNTWTQSGAQWEYSFQDTSMYLTGGVEVYYNDPVLGGYIQLPVVIDNQSIFYEMYPNTYTVEIFWENVNGTSTTPNPSVRSFEVVTIPAP